MTTREEKTEELAREEEERTDHSRGRCAYLTWSEMETIEETISQFNLSAEKQTKAIRLILEAARKGGRFYAYNATCNVCAKLSWPALPAKLDIQRAI